MWLRAVFRQDYRMLRANLCLEPCSNRGSGLRATLKFNTNKKTSGLNLLRTLRFSNGYSKCSLSIQV